MRAIMSEVSSDLLAWRAQIGVDRFDEMWEGVLHMNAAPHGDHQLLQDDLREWLKRRWARMHGALVFSQRNVAKSEEWPRNYRIPDLVLVPADRRTFDRGEYFAGAPLVAVEILSPHDETYDKLPFYAELGVPEVWIIHRDSKSVELRALEATGYKELESDEDGWVASPGTSVLLRRTPNDRLGVKLADDPESYAELPDD